MMLGLRGAGGRALVDCGSAAPIVVAIAPQIRIAAIVQSHPRLALQPKALRPYTTRATFFMSNKLQKTLASVELFQFTPAQLLLNTRYDTR